MKNIEKFCNSKFYEKYENTYFADCILKTVFDVEIKKHALYGIGSMGYEGIYNLNVQVIKDIFRSYPDEKDEGELLWKMIYSIYIDPDFAAIREYEGISCTADGLISIKRLRAHEGITPKLVEEYKKYRKIPIIYFPTEMGGINTSRLAEFGDRIDHTLYDIKNYYDMTKRNDCRLKSAFLKEKTNKWLEGLGSFEEVIKWLGVENVFTNAAYEVYDLEKQDGTVIDTYQETYSYQWSESYYENLKIKIEEFMCRGI